MDSPIITVLRAKPHGIPSEEYVSALRERLPAATVRHARTPAQARALVTDATVITGMDFDPSLLERATALRLFAAGSAGVGHLDLSAFEERGIAVTNASGVHAPNMAEQAIGSMLAFTRSLHRGWARQRRREWRHYAPHGELTGRTVTVVGLGAVGTAIVDRLAGFEVETIGVRYTPAKGGPTDEVIGFEAPALHDALARTDYLVIATPLSETTRGLIGADEFSILPPDAVLVNVARGGVVDTDALVDAIQGNKIHGAALDVTDPEPLPADHPLWEFANVLLTPHNSGHTAAYWERRADILAENLDRLASDGEGADLRNRVA